jgi:hypothetical protein
VPGVRFAGLTLVLATKIRIRRFANVIGIRLEEQELRDTFVGVDACWQRCGV